MNNINNISSNIYQSLYPGQHGVPGGSWGPSSGDFGFPAAMDWFFNRAPQPKDDLEKKAQAYADLQRRKKRAPEDVLLDYTFPDKVANKLKTAFVTTPKTVWRGLKGSSDYTFSDAMLVAKVPYYLGGFFLALSPFLARDKSKMIRQGAAVLQGSVSEGVRYGAAVLFYLLGTAGSHFLINTLYRVRYGIDLTMLYRTRTGQIEKVYASRDFARFDLLKQRHYAMMANKQGIPKDAYEGDGAVRDNIRHIISSSRALKLIVANLFSAIGAGYVARSDALLELPKIIPDIRHIWRNKKLGTLTKLGKTVSAAGYRFKTLALDCIDLSKGGFWRKVVVLGGLATIAATVLYIWFLGIPNKKYPRSVGESPDEFIQPHYAQQRQNSRTGTGANPATYPVSPSPSGGSGISYYNTYGRPQRAAPTKSPSGGSGISYYNTQGGSW